MTRIGFFIIALSIVWQAQGQTTWPIEKIGISEEDNFNDLKPIGNAIGSADIVVLDDWASADNGASYDAIGRLIHYLNQELGFDALIWNLGVYEGALMDLSLSQNDLPGGLNTMYKVWRESRSIQALAQYTVNSHQTSHPLTMMGNSCQFHAYGKSRLIDYLWTHKDQLGLTQLTTKKKELLDELWTKPKRLKDLSKEQLKKLDQEISELEKGVPETTGRLIQNMRWFVELESIRAFTPRDQVVAVVEQFRSETTDLNFQWMMDNSLKGKKVIIFGGWPALQERYKNRLYTLGVTGHSGSLGRPGQQAKPLQPTSEGFIEFFLNSKSQEILFMPVTENLKPYKSRLSEELTGAYDGILFIAKVYPNATGN